MRPEVRKSRIKSFLAAGFLLITFFNYGAQAGVAGVLNTGTSITPPPACLVLPMKFLPVNAVRNGTQVSVTWQVANEKNITK